MFRIALCCLLALAVLPSVARERVTLTVGGAPLQVSMPDGYRATSQDAPSLFSLSAAAMPPGVRLVEALVAEADLKRMVAGGAPQRPYLQVQVPRDAEALRFSAGEWDALRPMLAEQLGAVDLDALNRDAAVPMNERMSTAAGLPVALKLGELGKPVVYSVADGMVRYALRIPVSGTMAGTQVDAILACAGAALVLDGRLMMLNAYLRVGDGPDDGVAAVRAFLDEVVAATRDAGPPAVPPKR